MDNLTNVGESVLTEKLTLKDGRQIPKVGLGTWKMTESEVMEQAIDNAIACGYKHFDTAEMYENEHLVGAALKKACAKYGVKRQDLWITAKIPPWRMNYESAKESIQ